MEKNIKNCRLYNCCRDFERPSQKKIEKFYNILKNDRKVNVVIRGEKGTDIDGACGQLRQRNSK